jgi:hypothetical protein
VECAAAVELVLVEEDAVLVVRGPDAVSTWTGMPAAARRTQNDRSSENVVMPFGWVIWSNQWSPPRLAQGLERAPVDEQQAAPVPLTWNRASRG